MTTTVTRRDLFKFGGLAALGVAGASTLAGCGQPKTVAEAAAEKGLADTGAATGPAFLAPQEPITDFAETHEYDVVVVGAGESGLSAVHTALEAGARVACVQNINAAQTTGNMAASIDLTQTDEAAVQACVSFINWKSDYRSNRDLVNIWAHNSQEALAWWAEEAAKGGVESKPHDAVLSYNGYDIHLHANTYFHVEGNHNAAATVIAENLAAAGAEFFYNMPCKQLATDESGAVTGAICEDADGAHHLFTATKGVILACGDYSSNQEMLDYYAPDTKGFSLFTDFRDGSALVAGMNAGAIMTPHTHTKMIHGEPAAVRLEMPFLFVDQEGNRFMDETCCRMGYMNNFARPYLAKAGFADSTAAKFFSLVPANWESYYEEWKAASPYDISQYNGDNKVNPEKWITADTIEGLAEAMNAYAAENDWKLTNIDAAALADTVARYNELCAAGRDEDFGKAAKYLVPIEGVFGTAASSYLISMSYSLVGIIVALLLYDISKRLGVTVVIFAAIKGAEQVFVIWGKGVAEAMAAAGMNAGAQDAVIAVAVVAMMLAATLILLSEKELASRWGVRILDAGGLVEKTPEELRRDERAAELAEHARLTPRETEILALVAQGKNGPAIMQELFIAEGTFKAHMSHIYEKCGVANRRELVALLGAK